MTSSGAQKDYNPDFANYETAHLIFISRDAEQLTWLSPYLDQIMGNDDVSSKLQLHVYLTCKKKVDTLPSFLFWRAFNLREKQKFKEFKRKSMRGTLNDDRDIITQSPINLNLGRPDFRKIFESIHKKTPTDHFVYGCAQANIIDNVKKVCVEMTKATPDLFVFRYEHF